MRRSLRAFTAMPRVRSFLERGTDACALLKTPSESDQIIQAEVPVLRLLQVPRAATLKCGQGLQNLIGSDGGSSL